MDLLDGDISTDGMVDLLDRKYTPQGWNLWRRAIDGGWCVQVNADHELGKITETIDGTTIKDAMQRAADYIPAKKIRRCPRVLALCDFEVKKDGSKWAIWLDGNWQCGNLKSKTYAVECCRSQMAKSLNDAMAWRSEIGEYVRTHVEGVDFVFV